MRQPLIMCILFVVGAGPAGAQPAERPFAWSVTASPYHLGFPMMFASVERRVAARLGIVVDVGVGSYHGATLAQLGVRAPITLFGTPLIGVELGPFVRGSVVHYRDASARLGGSVTRDVAAAIINDAEITRSNGRDGLFYGGLLGAKWIATNRLRGMTIRIGVLVGYLSLFGASPYGPAPNASHVGGGFLPEVYADFGWSF